eukprot:12040-Heterococcus_DN1.PRE.2
MAPTMIDRESTGGRANPTDTVAPAPGPAPPSSCSAAPMPCAGASDSCKASADAGEEPCAAVACRNQETERASASVCTCAGSLYSDPKEDGGAGRRSQLSATASKAGANAGDEALHV